ncbi:dTDP-4-dehydrorhamnose 3,5-epimerase [Candidatus Thioglobus sp.]|nr:dTDP-4-dehydrorhamnose 3,5-epimerase [Candidatus Thioglobus sp.]
MIVKALSIPDVLLLEPKVFEDSRGFFFESFNQADFEEATNISPVFVQENHSSSKNAVLRGLHYQLPPAAQDKLVRVIQGEIFDVAVDLRKNSPTFGKWTGATLSSSNKKQIWIPKGFAHGFFVFSDTAEVAYKTTNYYAPEYDRCIFWNDPELNIDWNLNRADPILSSKDKNGILISNSEIFD